MKKVLKVIRNIAIIAAIGAAAYKVYEHFFKKEDEIETDLFDEEEEEEETE